MRVALKTTKTTSDGDAWKAVSYNNEMHFAIIGENVTRFKERLDLVPVLDAAFDDMIAAQKLTCCSWYVQDDAALEVPGQTIYLSLIHI